ncbi:energy transducer TonB [Chitinispirillales bacterium ANBcel5]|uniref:energy transducer TonB n=1 Tax=Cellulosispirillum alkaliphilum TaxID=3039283 RepID=UPI002A58D106|nr:energy transducer TonB [Chitinispirillales bacterium ANBcel5]
MVKTIRRNTRVTLYFVGLLCFIRGVVADQVPQTSDPVLPQELEITSADPVLISEGEFTFPVSLLKQGVKGCVELNVDLDRDGIVEMCHIVSSLEPLLDSLVCQSMIESEFSPAYVKGTPEPSTVFMNYCFDPKVIASGGGETDPDIEGVLLNWVTMEPVKGARVELYFSDTTVDRSVTVPFSDYLEIISNVPGQELYGNSLVTTTESCGSFSFRMIPHSPFILKVSASGYESISPAFTSIDTSGRRMRLYINELDSIEIDESEYEVVVHGATEREERFSTEEVQRSRGLTYYLSDLIHSHASVQAAPETRSKAIVRSGTPFENRYIVAGVPFLAPFHFGGSNYAEIDALMLSGISDAELLINRIAGKRVGASGFLLTVDPKMNEEFTHYRRRPELLLDFNIIGQDLLFAFPNSRNGNDLQIGFTRAENHTLRYVNNRFSHTSDHFSLGNPLTYGNINLYNSYWGENIKVEMFFWLAWDVWSDGSGENVFKPWGMGSITLQPTGNDLTITIGGSKQYFASENRFRHYTYINETNLANVVASASSSIDFLNLDSTNVECRIEYQQWEGSVEWGRSFLRDGFGDKGDETAVSVQSAMEKRLGSLNIGSDILVSGFLVDQNLGYIVDYGLSLSVLMGDIQFGLYGGRVTSRPDIRGLPDSNLRHKKLPTYMLSAPIYYTSQRFRTGLQPYVRRKPKELRINPYASVWVGSETDPVRAAGVDWEADLELAEWISVNSTVNYSFAQRKYEQQYREYEWNVPWTITGGAHLNLSPFHTYLKGIYNSGLFYYDEVPKKYRRLPAYKNLDLSIQYRNEDIDHRFIRRYDVYITCKNLMTTRNITNYYYTNDGSKRPVFGGDFTIDVGLKVGVRL